MSYVMHNKFVVMMISSQLWDISPGLTSRTKHFCRDDVKRQMKNFQKNLVCQHWLNFLCVIHFPTSDEISYSYRIWCAHEISYTSTCRLANENSFEESRLLLLTELSMFCSYQHFRRKISGRNVDQPQVLEDQRVENLRQCH